MKIKLLPKRGMKSTFMENAYLFLEQYYEEFLKEVTVFSKWSNRVQDISKHVNPSKNGCRKFWRIQYFLTMYIEENKNN